MSLYDKSSIALIPSGTKASKLYSVLPANGDGDFTHSRGSTATRVNKDGLIESVANNVPRLDYPLSSGVVGDCPHLLLEPSRSNIMLKSEEIDTAYWVKTSATITANDTVSPDGEQTAEKFNDNGSGTGVVQVYQNRLITINETHTFSIFAKKGTVDYISLRNENFGTPNNSTSYFNISNGTLGTVDSDHTAKIVDYGNGWYRCSITLTFGSDNYGAFIVRLNEADNTPNVVRNGAKNVYLWGGQIELGSYATSYIKTDTSSVTRSADLCGSSGTSAEFNDSESSFFVEIQAFAEESVNRYIVINDGAGSPYTNSLIIQYRNNGTVRVFHNGTDFDDAIHISAASFDQTVNHKIAVRYKENDMKVYIDGAAQSLNGSFVYQSISGLNELSFDINGALPFLGKIKQVIVFNEALSDSELETLTS